MAEVQNNLRYRMYGLVPYNLSPIQQGIQHGHGVVEYLMQNMNKYQTQDWANKDKTFIVLNGGTTNLDGSGTLNQHLETLKENGVIVSTFHEPDLGNQLTSVNFLVDERVWDYEKYPTQRIGGSPPSVGNVTLSIYIMPESDEDYAFRLGGVTNVFLRDFLRKFRLA